MFRPYVFEEEPMNLDRHPYFRRWVDPQTGVASYILDKRVAPMQQSFYFTNPSLSPDEKWLWFYAIFPPGDRNTLGVVSMDPGNPFIRHYPNAQYTEASPMADDDGSILFAMRNSVYRMTLEGETKVVCTLSPDYIKRRPLARLATHLTRSADGKYLLLDGELANFWFVALGETATGEVKVLHESGRCLDHGQFSPVNPKLFSLAQDWWIDNISGQYFPFDQRIWLMDTEPSIFEPLIADHWFRHGTQACHEWWSGDGWMCWTDYEKGVYECDVTVKGPRQAVHVWQGPLCHSHCDATRRYYCADESPYKWDRQPCKVKFFDRARGKEIDIVSAMPKPPMGRNPYHLDPHPQISPKGTCVVYTTTVRGLADIALAPVEGILERM
jgi:hypothetical protein